MSFSRIQASGTEVPRSTQIKEDTLVAFRQFDEMENKINSSSLYIEYCGVHTYFSKDDHGGPHSIPEINKMIDVFNANVIYIANELKEAKSFSHITLDEYCEGPSSENDEQTKLLRKQNADELSQLSQLTDFFPTLAEKMNRVTGRIRSFKGFDRTITLHKPLINKHQTFSWFHTFPQIRDVNTPFTINSHFNSIKYRPEFNPDEEILVLEPVKESLQTLLLEPVKESLEPVIEDLEPVIEGPKTSIPLTITSTHIENGSLGICCEPDWGKSPVAFVQSQPDTWTGLIPLNKEWKFVIIQDGVATKWENHFNRKHDDTVNFVILNQNDVNFS